MVTREGYTTITVSEELKERLKARKAHPRQSYEEVIVRLLDELVEKQKGGLRIMEEVRKCLGCGKELTAETAALWVENWAMCSECENKAEAMYDALSPEEQEAEDRRVGASW